TPVRSESHSASSASGLVTSCQKLTQLARATSATSGMTSRAMPSSAGATAKPGARTPVSLAIGARRGIPEAVLLQDLPPLGAQHEVHEVLRPGLLAQRGDRVG